MTDIIIQDQRTHEIAAEINALKRKTAQDVVRSAIEIGRLLCEAKDRVSHGEWGAWLQENVSYSTTNANNMMRLYKEYRAQDQLDIFGENGVDVFEGLNLSQAIALLELPQSARREFVENNDAQDMSVRELKAAIKEIKKAEERAEKAEERAYEAERNADVLQEQLEESKDAIEDLKSRLVEAQANPEISEADIERIKKEASAAAEEKAKKKIDSLKKSLEEEKKKNASATDTAKAEAQKTFESERAKILEDAKKQAEADAASQIEELRAELKRAKVDANPRLTVFKTLMKELQDIYRKMVQEIEGAYAEDGQLGAGLVSALESIVKTLHADVERMCNGG